MPLRNDLLKPISPDKPSGENLRYAPIYDKIKEARRQEEDLAQGEWARERKVADWPAVIKLTQENLATKSKDLQLVAWLAEAILRKEGIAAFRDTLNITREMIVQFWDDLYPELEDGDAELRATPLQWIGDRLEMPLKEQPLTRKGLNWYQYKDSRVVGSEAAADNSEKRAAREKLIAAGKVSLEDFDKSFEETPKQFYLDQEATYDSALQSLSALGDTCDEKFGGATPSFAGLRSALEEVRNTVHVFLQKKRETEPDPEPEPEPEPEPAPEAESADSAGGEESAAGTAARAGGPLPAEPVDAADAARRVMGVAKFLRRQDPLSPAAYLMASGFRWGELRARGDVVDQLLLAAPSSEVRQHLKRLSLEGKWKEVLAEAQTAAATECGRGWLDVHRYIARASSSLGPQYEPIRQAVASGVRGLLSYYPSLPGMTLMDDTATANSETIAWLREEVLASSEYSSPVLNQDEAPLSLSSPSAPDVFDAAQQAAKRGRPQEGIDILMREMGRERTGRGRFLRQSQLAQICVGAGFQAIAFPILQDLAAEIEKRKLEEWEAPELVAQALAMLMQCLGNEREDEKHRLYETICRLDPRTALAVQR